MAFAIDCVMQGYKVLGVESKTSKKGNPFRIVHVYKGGRTCDVSCTRPELFASVDQLAEMDVVSLPVVAVSGKERSYVSLVEPVAVV